MRVSCSAASAAAGWGVRDTWLEPQPLPRVGLYHRNASPATLGDWQAQWQPGAPVVALLFYRNHVQSANTAFVDTFCEHLLAQGPQPAADRCGKPQGDGLSGASAGLAG
jgi:cobalamin biosynthesis Mg chelatase CobN